MRRLRRVRQSSTATVGLFKQGHAAQALVYLNAAYVDDRGGDIAAHLGEVLWHLGRHTDADRIWAAAGLGDPDNALLKSTRRRLHADAASALHDST